MVKEGTGRGQVTMTPREGAALARDRGLGRRREQRCLRAGAAGAGNRQGKGGTSVGTLVLASVTGGSEEVPLLFLLYSQ